MNFHKGQIKVNGRWRRRPLGAVLPLVAFLIVLGIAFVAFTVDVMRTYFARSQVLYGAQAVALAAYGQQVRSIILPSAAAAQTNMLSFVQAQSQTTASAYNQAIAGPDTSSGTPSAFTSPILFADSDLAFVPNSQDTSEIFLQLTARRQGQDALKRSFVPLIFAFNNALFGSGNAPPLSQTGTVEPTETAEVIGQPASRLSQGAPHNSNVQAQLAGFAAFPLAVSNSQYAALYSSGTPLTVDLLSSSGYPALGAGHIRAAFVNLGAGSGNLSYYGTATGALAAKQVLGNLNYFVAPYTGELPPLQVERGSQLSAVASDTLLVDPTYAASIKTALNGIVPGGTYMFPVVATDPVQSDNAPANTVVGFALLTVTGITAALPPAITLRPAPSTVMPAASYDNALRTVQISGGGSPAAMPAPVAPFLDRPMQADGIEPRKPGLVLAPTLSPRALN